MYLDLVSKANNSKKSISWCVCVFCLLLRVIYMYHYPMVIFPCKMLLLTQYLSKWITVFLVGHCIAAEGWVWIESFWAIWMSTATQAAWFLCLTPTLRMRWELQLVCVLFTISHLIFTDLLFLWNGWMKCHSLKRLIIRVRSDCSDWVFD